MFYLQGLRQLIEKKSQRPLNMKHLSDDFMIYFGSDNTTENYPPLYLRFVKVQSLSPFSREISKKTQKYRTILTGFNQLGKLLNKALEIMQYPN